jgi:hypothetical protein
MYGIEQKKKIHKLLQPHSKFFVFEFNNLKNCGSIDVSEKKNNQEHLGYRYLMVPSDLDCGMLEFFPYQP